MSRTLAVALILFAAACAAPEPEPVVPDVAAVRAQIDSLWKRYSAATVAADSVAVTQLYTASPYLVESGLPTLRSAAELRATVQQVLGSVRILESSIEPELTEIAGDRVLQFGAYRDVVQSAGQPAQVVRGRFSAVLMRDSTSAWRVSRLIAVVDSTVPQASMPK